MVNRLQLLNSETVRISLRAPGNHVSDLESIAYSEINLVEFEHADYYKSEKNLLQLAHDFPELKPVVHFMNENGFYAYASDTHSTKFVRGSRIPTFWKPVVDGEYEVSDGGVIYKATVSEAVEKGEVPVTSMLVIFSSMSFPFNKASLMRYFEQNYSSVHKFVSDGTLVLRVADLDGVVGGFYLPSVNYPDRPSDVRDVIESVRKLFNIDRERVVLYGASKGGTAALHLNLRFGYPAVAVDPVVDDESYEERYDDTHWTTGSVFLQRKADYLAQFVQDGANE
uniref:XcbB/CpsF family capsular polysaccharide biosynthesis protein n=1 Tax=Corynebacterium stationis TaxID=1705 RepID=UPI00260C91C7